jgi:hypothetical protein
LSRSWGSRLAVIVSVGILSRVVPTGFVLFDKYLGDLLYAVMVYAILRLRWTSGLAAVWSVAIMLAVELFQLTLIAAEMLKSEHLVVRIIARLMGTHFSSVDLLTYVVGIGCIYVVDSSRKL